MQKGISYVDYDVSKDKEKVKEIKHPILGDWQYQRQFQCSYAPSYHLLHASTIEFNHPFTGKKTSIEAPLPDDFLQAMEKLL